MKFNIRKTGGIKVYFVGEDCSSDHPSFDWVRKHYEFKGKVGDVYVSIQNEGDSAVFLGYGKKEDLTVDDLRLMAYNLGKELRKHKVDEVEIELPEFSLCQKKSLMAIYEGFRQGEYRFSYKTDLEPIPELTVNYTPHHGPQEKLEEGLNRITNVMDGVFLARDLVNQTANYMYPETLAEKAKEELEKVGVKVTIFEREEIEKMGMEAYLSVAKGSDKEPRFILMEYRGDSESEVTTGLVGKGLTYDSGGYSIKPSMSMNGMHSDMGGAGTVIGTMYAIGASKVKANVTAVVAACENLISGHAYKVGDIISSLSGKTIEVDNTDAEGRLTLADAIYYITHEKKVDRVVDLATLTGACLVALGQTYTGAITNDEDFFNELNESAKEEGEKIWLLPNDEKFKKLNDSKVADIKNTGGRFGGTITAGQFVGSFIDGDTPWVHLDIAGTAYLDKGDGYLPERATGIHVKTLYNLVDPSPSC